MVHTPTSSLELAHQSPSSAHAQGVKYEIRDPADAVVKTSGCDNEVRAMRCCS